MPTLQLLCIFHFDFQSDSVFLVHVPSKIFIAKLMIRLRSAKIKILVKSHSDFPTFFHFDYQSRQRKVFLDHIPFLAKLMIGFRSTPISLVEANMSPKKDSKL